MDLIQQIVKSLGISEDQAKGGMGLILKLIKGKLEASDFAKLAELIPGADSLVDAAPSEEGGKEAGGLMGMVGKLTSAFGGKGGGLGDVAGLVAGFSKLGLDPTMIVDFIKKLTGFVQEKGDDQIAGLISGIVPSDDETPS